MNDHAQKHKTPQDYSGQVIQPDADIPGDSWCNKLHIMTTWYEPILNKNYLFLEGCGLD
jgi:hypothetical protein